MINKVYNTIQEYGLIKPGDKIIIGLSGGADSVCLTHILWSLRDKLGIFLHTAHMNHNIRGEEADSDAVFAEEFSKKLGIPFTLKSENVIEYSKKNGMSEELAGRELRYTFFDELLYKNNFNKIATAHNRNDNAETILMNFMRGSGLKGLSGIPYKRGKIIRPILDITRDEIEKYCSENNLCYVTDSTNKEKTYTRNKIRLELIPEIQNTFNLNFINTITENAKIINNDSTFLDGLAKDFYNQNVNNQRIDVNNLLQQPLSICSRVIIEMISDAEGKVSDLSGNYVNDIINLAKKNKSGLSINLPGGVCAAIEYGKLYIGKIYECTDFEYDIPINKHIFIKELNKHVYAEYVYKKDDNNSIYLFAEPNDKIVIRNRRKGDIFYPDGMTGRKKIKDFFIDSKIPRTERNMAGIVTINGEIAYIVEKRYDRRFKFKGKGIKITFI